VGKLKYLEKMATKQTCIHEEIKSRLHLGNACCHAVQNLLSFRQLSKNVKIKLHKTIILFAVLYWPNTLSVTIHEQHRLRVFENRVLRCISGPKRGEAIRV
jgi:hypothetical protein